MPRRRSINPPLNIYKKIAISFIVLTLVLIAVIFYFTLSYAYVTIYPKTEEIKTDFKFIVVEDTSLENIADGIFSGKVINQIIDDQKTVETTGTITLAGDTVGRVKIYNNNNNEQVLIQKTRLQTADGVLFRLINRELIPANSTIEADVYPDDPAKPLATAGTKFTIPGLNTTLQKYIYAEAVTDFHSGGQVVKAVTQEEMDKALAQFSEEAAQKVFGEEDASKTKILTKEIVESSFSNKAGDQVAQYTIKLKIKVVGVIFDPKQVENYALKFLEGLVPDDKELISNNADQLIYEISKYDLENKLVEIKSNIGGVVVLSLNSPILERSKLVKLSYAEIQAYLENFDDIERAEVTFFPSWVKKVPSFQDHIIIKIKQ